MYRKKELLQNSLRVLQIFSSFSLVILEIHQNVSLNSIKFLVKSFHNFMEFLPKFPQTFITFSIISLKFSHVFLEFATIFQGSSKFKWTESWSWTREGVFLSHNLHRTKKVHDLEKKNWEYCDYFQN